MDITITYCLVGETESRELKLTPEQYYDPLEQGENYWDDGIERCAFPHGYLDLEPEAMKWVYARVSNGDRCRLSRVQFLNGEKVIIQHEVRENEEEEIILSTLLPNGEYHCARILKPQGGSWTVVRLALDRDDVDINSGNMGSTNLIVGRRFEELKLFSKIGNPSTR